MYIDHSKESVSHGAPTPQLVQSAQIMEVSLQRLEMGDKTETSKLLAACREDGVFYLNLRNHENHDGPLLSISTEIFNLSKELFKLPLDEKMNYDIDKAGNMKVNGYKPVGRNKGGLTGNKDGFESYAIAKDFITSPATVKYTHAHPTPIMNHLPLLQDFATKVTSAASVMLRCLSTALELPPGTGFDAYHRPEAPSPSMLRLLKYTEQSPSERGAPQNPHTDLGALTLLFTRSPGLQRRNPRHQKTTADGNDNNGNGNDESSAWEFIEPRPHCAIVNVGDVMVALSGGMLHSCFHRVAPLPGQKMEERFSFAWMTRPEPATLMTGLKGGKIPASEGIRDGQKVLTSGEWLERKFTVLRK